MIRLERTASFLLVGLLSGCSANALTVDRAGGPYDGIAARNVFRLQAPLSSARPEPTNMIPLPKIVLTGITSILGRDVAFITVVGIKPGAPSESVMLAEGQSLNDIQVKSIDPKTGLVQVTNHGKLQILDFDHTAAKSSNPTPGDIPVSPLPAVLNVPQPVSAVSPEEQVALIEVQRAKFEAEDNPIRNILPPSGLPTDNSEK